MSEIIPFQYPGNAMINFAPLDSALKDYQTGMQVAGESTAKINAANAMKAGDFKGAQAELAKVDPRAALEVGMYPTTQALKQNELEKSTRSLIGGTAEALSAIPDPALRAQTAQKIFSTDPKWAAGATKMGFDINNPAHIDPLIAAMREEALGPQAPEQKAYLRAETAAKSVMPAPAGTNLTNVNPAAGPVGQVVGSGGLPEGDRKFVRDINKEVEGVRGIVSLLDQAKGYSDKAYSGILAPADTYLINKVLPSGLTSQEQKDRANATEQFSTIMQGQGLKALKGDIGGRANMYVERLEQALQPNSGDPPKVRAEKIARARQELIDHASELVRQAGQTQTGAIYKTPPTAPGQPTQGGAVQNGAMEGERVPRSFTDRLPQSQIPPQAVRDLLAHPELATQFNIKYGNGQDVASQFLTPR